MRTFRLSGLRLIGVAVVLAGSMMNEWTVNGSFSAFWSISQHGLMPAAYLFAAIAVVGIAFAIWGIFECHNISPRSSAGDRGYCPRGTGSCARPRRGDHFAADKAVC